MSVLPPPATFRIILMDALYK